MPDIGGRTVYDEDQEAFRATVRRFMEDEIAPNAAQWDRDKIVPREVWPKAGELGMLCPTVPEEYGGLGLDFRYNAIVDEEAAYHGGAPLGFSLQSDIVCNYLVAYGSKEQKEHWLPKMVSGEVITAIAMTEPGVGSDLQSITTTAIKDGNHYVVNGSKTYITNGQNADLVLVCAKTDPHATPGWKGVSIILVEADRDGFARGKNLDKIGQDAADTSEMFFNDVRVPITNCLGEEGKGFVYLMSELPQERLSIAVSAQASAQKGVRRHGGLREGQESVRKVRVRLPEHPLHARRPEDQAAGRLGASGLGAGPAGGRRADPRRGRGRQAVAHGVAVGGHGQVPATARRRGLHERIPDRADVEGGAGDPHFRGGRARS